MENELKRLQFTFYRSYYDAIKVLPKKEQTAVMLALCAYALDKVEPNLTGTAGAIFTLIRPTLDSGWKKAIGGARGTPQKDNEKIEERCGKDTAKEKEVEKEKEGEIEIENECYTPKPPKGAKRFSPPTVEEVAAYCLERNNGIDAQHFVDYYAQQKWKLSNGNKMADWKAAVRTWESRDKMRSRSGRDNGFETNNPFLEMLEERRGMG